MATAVTANAQIAGWQWAVGAIGGGNDRISDIATDAQGNVYVTGSFTGQISLGGTLLSSAGKADILVAKYNPAGVLLWARKAGGSEVDEGNGIALDAAGNVYVAGIFSMTADFDTASVTSAGNDDFFLASYAPNGALRWLKRGGGPNREKLGGIRSGGLTVTNYNHVVIAGTFSAGTTQTPGIIQFDTVTLTSAGGPDIFLARYDTSGQLIWAKRAGAALSEYCSDVETDSFGNLYLTGSFVSNTQFGSIVLPNTSNSSNVFVAKYDSSGSVLWAQRANGNQSNDAYSIAVDKSGKVSITGRYRGNISFGSVTLPSYGDDDVFIARYDAFGQLQWARHAGWGSWDYGFGIAMDAASNSYVTGSFNHRGIFESDTLESYSFNSSDAFVAKYDAAGSLQWVQQAGEAGNDQGNAIVLDPSGALLVAGEFSGSSSLFGSHQISGSGGTSLFIAKLSQLPVSVPEQAAVSTVSVYPNPTTGQPLISWQQQATALTITDAAGRVVFQTPLGAGQRQLRPVLGHLSAGLYFIRLIGRQGSETQKLQIR